MKNDKHKHKEVNQSKLEKEVSRREVLIKTSKYVTFTAASMLTFYSPKKAQAGSLTPQNPGW